MRDLLRSVFRAFSERHAKPRALRYHRHPEVKVFGEALFPAEGSDDPMVLNEVGSFIWKQLEVPRTEEQLVSAVTSEFSVDPRKARKDLRSFLDELSTKGLVVAMSGSLDPVVTAARPSQSAALLSAAYDRQKSGDWTGALSLCIEATQEAEYPEIVDLNILICKYHLGSVAQLAGRALALAPRLPTLARIACWGLAMASAHKAGDLGSTKSVACELARQVLNPWDLPTVPTFVYRMGEKVIVTEDSAVDSVLEMVHSAQTMSVNTPEETALLKVLAQRYRERRAE